MLRASSNVNIVGQRFGPVTRAGTRVIQFRRVAIGASPRPASSCLVVHVLAKSPVPSGANVAPVYCTLWTDVESRTCDLVDRACCRINRTAVVGFTANVEMHYRREGSALLMPDYRKAVHSVSLSRPYDSVSQLCNITSSGNNHITLLSRLFALLHASFIVCAVAGRWVRED